MSIAQQASRFMRRSSPGEKVFHFFAYLFLVIWAIVSLFPFYYMIVTALNPPSFVQSVPPELLLRTISSANIVELFGGRPWLRWTINSAITTGGVTLAQCITASMAGYGFAKKEFPGREAIFWLFMSSMMIPSFALIIPLYRLTVAFRLTNTYLGIMVPGLSTAFGTFLMRQFMRTLPNELIDAARIDGCSEIAAFVKIILPLSLPGLAVLGIFVFVSEWGAFLWPMIVAGRDDMKVLTVAVATLGRSELRTNFGAVMAGSSYIAIPMFIVFFTFARYFLRGVTIGALKG